MQSHWFSVGGLVAWAEAGVGAVATQANIEVSYGAAAWRGCARARTPARRSRPSLAADAHAGFRQAAIVDAAGRVAVHTGADCMEFAGHVAGAHHSCQANMMAAPGVPEAMSAAFEATGGDLTTRLLAALDAAEAAGGDVRGRQSAAILVVPGAGEPWERPSTCGSRTTPSRSSSSAAWSSSTTPTRRRRAATSWRRRRPRRRRAPYIEAHERLPDSTELEFWAAWR